MYHSQLKGTILLLITALIWGAAFVAQSVGMDYIGPFTFSAARDVIAISFSTSPSQRFSASAENVRKVGISL